jgi:hypothetical protein
MEYDNMTTNLIDNVQLLDISRPASTRTGEAGCPTDVWRKLLDAKDKGTVREKSSKPSRVGENPTTSS